MSRYVAAFITLDCLLIVVGVLTHNPGPVFLGALGVFAGCVSWLLRRAGARRGRQ